MDSGKCDGRGPASSDAPDSPDDLLANSLATLDDDTYADRLKVQCKLTLSNPTTPTGAAADRYPVRPPSWDSVSRPNRCCSPTRFWSVSGRERSSRARQAPCVQKCAPTAADKPRPSLWFLRRRCGAVHYLDAGPSWQTVSHFRCTRIASWKKNAIIWIAPVPPRYLQIIFSYFIISPICISTFIFTLFTLTISNYSFSMYWKFVLKDIDWHLTRYAWCID